MRYVKEVRNGELVVVRIPDPDEGPAVSDNSAGSFEAFLGMFAPGQLGPHELARAAQADLGDETCV